MTQIINGYSFINCCWRRWSERPAGWRTSIVSQHAAENGGNILKTIIWVILKLHSSHAVFGKACMPLKV